MEHQDPPPYTILECKQKETNLAVNHELPFPEVVRAFRCCKGKIVLVVLWISYSKLQNKQKLVLNVKKV